LPIRFLLTARHCAQIDCGANPDVAKRFGFRGFVKTVLFRNKKVSGTASINKSATNKFARLLSFG
jgi:hypothetical protein